MSVYVPCLNVDKIDSGGGLSIGVGSGVTGEGGTTPVPGVSITHSDSPVTLTITPFPPFIFFGPNFEFWAKMFGIGTTRIDREKFQIQHVMTGIFRYLNRSYGVPITDDHALNFNSDGVRAQFARRPDIAALQPYVAQQSGLVANLIFAKDDATLGQEQRVGNQFLANAAYNNWPVSATTQIWDGIVNAANPACPNDAQRWIYNPEIMRAAAQMAVLLQYVPLDVLLEYAKRNALGTFVQADIVKMWGENPRLVDSVPRGLSAPWSDLYQTFMPGYFAEQDDAGNIIPLTGRSGIGALVNSVVVQGAAYPDFAPVGPQGIPSPGSQSPPQPPTSQPPTQPPGPQPSPTPAPQPGPEPAPQPGPSPQPQPNPTPTPQPQPPSGPGQTVEIPNQADYERACQITGKLTRGEPVSQADMDWMLTVIGSKALTWAVNEPRCGLVGRQPLDPNFPQGPDCPPSQPGPSPSPQPAPWPPRPQPLPPSNPNQPCPPDCQRQILQLQERIKECCDRTEFVVIPELKFILEWLVDLERRVPGVPPALPPPPLPIPPPRNLDPIPPPEPEPPGTEPEPPPIPDPCRKFLEELCEPGKFCAKVKECSPERELECIPLQLCDEAGGVWGAIGECWLSKNTPIPANIAGVLAGKSYPSYGTAAVLNTWLNVKGPAGATPTQGQGQGPQATQQGPSARFLVNGAVSRAIVLAAWRGEDSEAKGDTGARIRQRPWIFANEDAPSATSIKIRSLKLRDGEVDPCTGVAQGTLEIPATA